MMIAKISNGIMESFKNRFRNSFRLDNFHLGMVKVQYLRCGYAIEKCPVFWSAIRQTLVMSIRIQSQLWNRFPEIFGARKIDFLTADREFVGDRVV